MKNISSLTVKEIAKLTGGKLSVDSDAIINGANTLEKAEEGEVTFLANPKYGKWLDKTNASCVLVSRNINTSIEIPVIEVDNPDSAFSMVLNKLYGEKKHPVKGVSDKAAVDDTAVVGKGVRIGDFTKIEAGVNIGDSTVVYPHVYMGENVSVGSNCVIYPGVSIMDSVKIANNVIIHSCSIIGSDGFGYSTINGKHVKVPQVGSVIIEDDVEIGSNVCVDRGSPGDTVIENGAKIDNLVQIAHNVRIGKNCFIISQVGIAGSTVVGDNAVLAGQAGVVGHITVGAGAQVGAQAGVTRDIEPGQLVSGYPAMNHRQAKRINALVRKLPKLFKEVERINRIIGEDNG